MVAVRKKKGGGQAGGGKIVRIRPKVKRGPAGVTQTGLSTYGIET